MAEKKSSELLIRVIDPDGNHHIVPAENRRTIERMNQFARGNQKKYQIYDYDPSKPDHIDVPKSQPYTDVVAKLSTEIKSKDAEIAALKAEIAAKKEVKKPATK